MTTQQIGDRDAASVSFRIPTIWLSLNFDFLITAPLSREQSTFECLLRGEADALVWLRSPPSHQDRSIFWST